MAFSKSSSLNFYRPIKSNIQNTSHTTIGINRIHGWDNINNIVNDLRLTYLKNVLPLTDSQSVHGVLQALIDFNRIVNARQAVKQRP